MLSVADEDKRYIFISYTNQDNAKKIAQEIKTVVDAVIESTPIFTAFAPYIDVEEIFAGDELSTRILKAIDRSCIFIEVQTKLYGLSEWTRKEKRFAEDLQTARGLTIIPVVVIESGDTTAPKQDDTIHYILYNDCQWKENLQKSIQIQLRRLIETRNRTNAPDRSPIRTNGFLDRTLTDATTELASRHFVGRDGEVNLLNKLYLSPEFSIVSLIGCSGIGKSYLAAQWLLQTVATNASRELDTGFCWVFQKNNIDAFFSEIFSHLGEPLDDSPTPATRGRRLADLLKRRKTFLLLDQLDQVSGYDNKLTNYPEEIQTLLCSLADSSTVTDSRYSGMCLITSKTEKIGIAARAGVHQLVLTPLTTPDSVELIKLYNVPATNADRERAAALLQNHPFSISLFARYAAHVCESAEEVHVLLDNLSYRFLSLTRLAADLDEDSLNNIMTEYTSWLTAREDVGGPGHDRLAVLYASGYFDDYIDINALEHLLSHSKFESSWLPSSKLTGDRLRILLSDLASLGLVSLSRCEHSPSQVYRPHTIVRDYFSAVVAESMPAVFQAGHSILFDYYVSVGKEHESRSCGPCRRSVECYFAAIVHGCKSGRHQDAYVDVWVPLVCGGKESRAFLQFGFVSQGLRALAAFFEEGESSWSVVSNRFRDSQKEQILNYAGIHLMESGMLKASQEAFLNCLEKRKKYRPKYVAMTYAHLSEVSGLLGQGKEANRHAMQGLQVSDDTPDSAGRAECRLAVAVNLFWYGENISNDSTESGSVQQYFGQAKEVFSMVEIGDDMGGVAAVEREIFCRFHYSEFLLQAVEQAVWRKILSSNAVFSGPIVAMSHEEVLARVEYHAVKAYRLCQAERGENGLNRYSGLDLLIAGRVQLYKSILHAEIPSSIAGERLDKAGVLLKNFGRFLPMVLISQALERHCSGDLRKRDWLLSEALNVSLESMMVPIKADCLLAKGRLLRDASIVSVARQIVDEIHYKRRVDELLDAEFVLGSHS